MVMKSLLLVLLLVTAVGPGWSANPDNEGVGWVLESTDIEVYIDERNERLEVTTRSRLKLSGNEWSLGPTLAINAGFEVMRFVDVRADGASSVEFDSDRENEATKLAHVRFEQPLHRGDIVIVEATIESDKIAPQFVVSDELAFISWVHGWYPWPLPSNGHGMYQQVATPGKTTVYAPAGWQVVSNGSRSERRADDEGVVEVWETDTPVNRSFGAGPYKTALYEADGHQITTYLLHDDGDRGREEAEMLARAIRVMENYFGPHPLPYHAIGEVPAWVPGFYADSEQGYIMAKSSAFGLERANIALFGHEAAHGWWATLVGTEGPGAIFLSESLAQYSAVIAIEAIYGEAAATEFLRFGVGGFSPNHDASAYFRFVRQGSDKAIIKITEGGGINHYLADSKGPWIYHMLRRRVGDDVFFASLREIIDTHAGEALSLEEMESVFINNADEDAAIERFFEQWLTQSGAPVLDVDWRNSGGEVEVTVKQVQGGATFDLWLDVALDMRDGTTVAKRIDVSGRKTRVTFDVGAEVELVRLDPAHRLLIWTPEYGPRP